MMLFLLFVCFGVLGLCLADTKTKRLGFFGTLFGILYFPIGVILAISKNKKYH